MTNRLTAIILATICALHCSHALGAVKMPMIFGDHMMLQQNASLPVWGTADANEKVVVTLDDQTRQTTADEHGKWRVSFKPLKNNQTVVLNVVDGAGAKTTFTDVLVGDVWFCSGQSNMQFNLGSAAGGPEEIKSANLPQIRLFFVPWNIAFKPQDDLAFGHSNKMGGKWEVCTPETVGKYSAVAYYFGKMLNKDLNQPIGLINSCWGGTIAEAWTNRDAMAAVPELKKWADSPDLDPSKTAEVRAAYEQAMKAWKPLADGDAADAQLAALKPADFKPVAVPTTVESVAGDPTFDGAIWFRKQIDVPAEDAGKNLLLDLGPIDDLDVTYFNGRRVGATKSETPTPWEVARKYSVPGDLVKAGANEIAVRVFDEYGPGSFGTKPMKLLAGQTVVVDLGGEWLCKVEQKVVLPDAPKGADNPNIPSVLYNGMVHPIMPLPIKGAIWYQGESNESRGQEYQVMLSTLVKSWRQEWNCGEFPFILVSLANFHDQPKTPNDEAHWAFVRESMFIVTQTVPNTGEGLAIDVGEAKDIHPKDKQTVGNRLALVAKKLAYGDKSVECEGPTVDAVKFENGKAVVTLKHAGGLKTKDGGAVKGFTLAGEDGKYTWADASIDGETVVVHSDAIKAPTMLRYAWADNPPTNLYNAANLPAVPFRWEKR